MGKYISDKDAWSKEFGINLQRMLHRKGITQGYLAKELGITEPMLSRYICGSCVPNAYRISQMAEVIGCDASDLIKTKFDI